MTRARTPFEDTSVSIQRSQDSIRKLLRGAGALGVQFEEAWGDPPICRIRFVWPLEGGSQHASVRLEVTPLPPDGSRLDTDQRERQAWRGLAHYLEGTIKAATFGLIRFEDIFLSFIEDSSTGQTIGEVLLPQLGEGRLALPRET